ncbi:hypothetical protein CTAYLR_003892 [Chrysophaeum taylorii]|uniref:Uncharacterized protein n=1 Tax=Chrysophaeum taylorii TaxID=2483200 RepID=A0AAD7UKJ8_9STRA|nr:hypothetical protein CTAYLR_003892 [Chrysophaeum taylorii]
MWALWWRVVFLLLGQAGALVPSPPLRCGVEAWGKKKKTNRERAWAERKKAEACAVARRRGRATDLEPSWLAVRGTRVEEDHRYEQFFFDEATTARLAGLALAYERPLLVGVPSLAVALDGKRDYLLLDRDERFQELRWEPFDFARPCPLDSGFEFDALFADPPFANVDIDQFAAALRVLCGGGGPSTPPIFVCYSIKRAAQLAEALRDLGHLRQRGPCLSYACGLMPQQIGLFSTTTAL